MTLVLGGHMAMPGHGLLGQIPPPERSLSVTERSSAQLPSDFTVSGAAIPSDPTGTVLLWTEHEPTGILVDNGAIRRVRTYARGIIGVTSASPETRFRQGFLSDTLPRLCLRELERHVLDADTRISNVVHFAGRGLLVYAPASNKALQIGQLGAPATYNLGRESDLLALRAYDEGIEALHTTPLRITRHPYGEARDARTTPLASFDTIGGHPEAAVWADGWHVATLQSDSILQLLAISPDYPRLLDTITLPAAATTGPRPTAHLRATGRWLILTLTRWPFTVRVYGRDRQLKQVSRRSVTAAEVSGLSAPRDSALLISLPAVAVNDRVLLQTIVDMRSLRRKYHLIDIDSGTVRTTEARHGVSFIASVPSREQLIGTRQLRNKEVIVYDVRWGCK